MKTDISLVKFLQSLFSGCIRVWGGSEPERTVLGDTVRPCQREKRAEDDSGSCGDLLPDDVSSEVLFRSSWVHFLTFTLRMSFGDRGPPTFLGAGFL